MSTRITLDVDEGWLQFILDAHLLVEGDELFEIVSSSKNTAWPCYYTKGVESCFHVGCREAHEDGEDFEVWMAREGDPCRVCGVATFERCDNAECDEVVHDACGGYCKEHHCYIVNCEVCPEWPVQIAKEQA